MQAQCHTHPFKGEEAEKGFRRTKLVIWSDTGVNEGSQRANRWHVWCKAYVSTVICFSVPLFNTQRGLFKKMQTSMTRKSGKMWKRVALPEKYLSHTGEHNANASFSVHKQSVGFTRKILVCQMWPLPYFYFWWIIFCWYRSYNPQIVHL